MQLRRRATADIQPLNGDGTVSGAPNRHSPSNTRFSLVSVAGIVLRVLRSPKMIGLHLFTILLIVVMVNLGFWQLRRHDERVAFNDSVRARSQEAPRSVDALLAISARSPVDIEWYLVSVSGRYLADEDLLAVNVAQGGRAGIDPIGALQLDDGRILLVNRGFIPLAHAVPPTPSGTVHVSGRVRASQERHRGELSDPATGELREVQRIDVQRIALQLPGSVLPFYVDLLSSEPSDSPALSRIAGPTLTIGSHLSYAVQWFVFSACALVAWMFVVRRALATAHRSPAPA